MNKFKAGDKVVCCNDESQSVFGETVNLTVGKEYEVLSHCENVLTVKADDRGIKDWFNACRFKAVIQNIQEIKQYKTPDGKVFDTIKDAEAWLNVKEIKDILWGKSLGVPWDDYYNTILSKFSITRK